MRKVLTSLLLTGMLIAGNGCRNDEQEKGEYPAEKILSAKPIAKIPAIRDCILVKMNDVDKDGDDDMIVATISKNKEGNVFVFYNDGKGNFYSK